MVESSKTNKEAAKYLGTILANAPVNSNNESVISTWFENSSSEIVAAVIDLTKNHIKICGGKVIEHQGQASTTSLSWIEQENKKLLDDLMNRHAKMRATILQLFFTIEQRTALDEKPSKPVSRLDF